jgi:hypothetical protein
MSSDEYTNANFSKALEFLSPKVDSWIRELFKGFDALKLSRTQKDLFQGLTVETMLFNTLMSNEEIVAALAGIIQNIATKHSYSNSLDWGKRAKAFEKYSDDAK